MKDKHGLGEVQPYTQSHRCLGVHASRTLDAIDVVWAMNQKEAFRGKPSIRVMDLSQNCWRTASMGHGIPTLTTSSDLFLFTRDRIATPVEHALVMGWPHDEDLVRLSRFPHTQIRDLIGESMAVPSIASVLIAVAFAFFRTQQDGPS